MYSAYKLNNGFPGNSDCKKSASNEGDPGLIPGRRECLTTPAFLPGEFYGQRSLVNPYIVMGSEIVRHD